MDVSNGEPEVLQHDVVEPYPTVFRIVFALTSLYLIVILLSSWSHP